MGKDEHGALESKTLLRDSDKTYELEKDNADSARLEGVCGAAQAASGGKAARMLLQFRRGEEETMVDVEEDNQGGEEDQSGEEEETMVDVEEDNQGDEEDQSGEGAAEGSGGRRRRKRNRRN